MNDKTAPEEDMTEGAASELNAGLGIQLIHEHSRYCGTCKYFEASLCKPTESTNTWETWFNNDEPADCHRFPPVFVGGDTGEKTEDGDFGSLNWQYPKIHVYSRMCGEYARAEWLPNEKVQRDAACGGSAGT